MPRVACPSFANSIDFEAFLDWLVAELLCVCMSAFVEHNHLIERQVPLEGVVSLEALIERVNQRLNLVDSASANVSPLALSSVVSFGLRTDQVEVGLNLKHNQQGKAKIEATVLARRRQLHQNNFLPADSKACPLPDGIAGRSLCHLLSGSRNQTLSASSH